MGEKKMIILTEYDKKMIDALIHLLHYEYEKSIDKFNDALKLKSSPLVYYNLAQAYIGLRKYNEAQKYALLAIENGYDAYALYAKITIGNLQKVNDAVKVLENGIKKQNPSACFETARLHIDNNLEPDMNDPYEASKYLDLAFHYTPVEKRGTMAYSISKMYKTIYNMYPYFIDFKDENSELHYYKIFLDYGGLLFPNEFANIEAFDIADANDDNTILDYLYENFNGDAMFIFSLMLLEEEYKTTGTIEIKDNLGLLTACEGASKFKHSGCSAICALIFGSDFCQDDELYFEQALKLLNQSKLNKNVIPVRFEKFFKELMNHIYSNVEDGDTVLVD